MSNTFTDPATGRQYTVDAATGQTVWVDQPHPPAPPTQGPPPGGPPQWSPPPAAAKKKGHPVRNILLVVVGVIVVIGIISAVANGGSSTSDGTASAGSDAAVSGGASAAGKPAAKVAAIGTPVRDGKFEFTVTKVKRDVTKIGDEYFNTKAQGEFVLITVKVENIGDEAQMFDGSNQYIYDTSGRKFEASSEAAVYMSDEANSFLNDINPGNTVTGVVVFDIPKGTKLAKIELHDSAFSGGIDVSLG